MKIFKMIFYSYCQNIIIATILLYIGSSSLLLFHHHASKQFYDIDISTAHHRWCTHAHWKHCWNCWPPLLGVM